MHITTTAALHSIIEHEFHIGTHKLVRRLTARYEMMCMCPLAHVHTLLSTLPRHVWPDTEPSRMISSHKSKSRVSSANTLFCYLDKHKGPAACLDENTASDHPYSILRLAWCPVECGKAPCSRLKTASKKKPLAAIDTEEGAQSWRDLQQWSDWV